MFGVLNSFIDILLKGAQSIQLIKSSSSEKRVRELAGTFALAHAALVQIWVSGEDLLEDAQTIQNQADQIALEDVASENTLGIWKLASIKSNMMTMAENLRHASSLLYEVKEFSALVEPSWQRQLDRMLGGKMGLIDGLAEDLRSDLLPRSCDLDSHDSSGGNWEPIRVTGSTAFKKEHLDLTSNEVTILALKDIATTLDLKKMQADNDLFESKIKQLGEFIAQQFTASELMSVDPKRARQLRW